MISDDESRLAFKKQAKEWLMEYGCFSVERLFEDLCSVLRNITKSEVCAAFLCIVERSVHCFAVLKGIIFNRVIIFQFPVYPNLRSHAGLIPSTTHQSVYAHNPSFCKTKAGNGLSAKF